MFSDPPSKPFVTPGISGTVVRAGTYAEFKCNITDKGFPVVNRYQWKRDDELLQDTESYLVFLENTVGTFSYTCMARNGYTTRSSDPLTITVQGNA